MSARRKAVVVGTGAGGLAAAAYLARDGFEVLALDQADRIGGFLAPFVIDGYSFDPGVHYVGRARRGQPFDRVLGGLGIDVERLFVELPPDGFDVYRFPDFEVRMCRGLERYRDRLIERFPGDRDGLRQFFDLVAAFGDLSGRWPMGRRRPRLEDLAALRRAPVVMRWAHSSFASLLEHTLRDPHARAVLGALDGDVGLPPSELAALVGIGILDHYLDGAFFPRGGSGALRDALVASASKNGAAFRTSADVAEILVQHGAVTGVRLIDGERIAADVVVSDVDPTVTFGKLLDPSAVPGGLRRKAKRMKPSLGSFTIFLGMRRDLRARGFGAFNVWHYPSWDLEAAYGPSLAGRIPERPALFLSSSSLRDDSGTLAPAGCSTLSVTSFIPWEPFARWAEIPPAERGSDYRQLRQELTDRLLAETERAWPGLVGDVAVQRVATPLSNTDYTRAVRGGIYGPANTVGQVGPGRFGTRTPIRGLFLAGAGVNGCGVLPCLSSGRAAAKAASRMPATRRTVLQRILRPASAAPPGSMR